MIGKGLDESNLGRWVWTRYKGKGNHTLRILVAYRSNPPQGPYTVYAQQNSYFHSVNRSICPRHAFLTDLREAINQGLEAGDHLIILMDGNSNMKKSDLSTMLQQLHLQEIILYKHGMSGPATHKRNSTSSPIDGIRMSQGLHIETCGYFAYDQVIASDHRCLWVDLSFMSAFGHNMPPLCRRTPKRLHCRDPRLIENFVRLYHQFAERLNLFNRIHNFEKNAPYMSKYEIAQTYEELDLLRCETTSFAERHCRKLRTGQVAFSPELNLSRLKISALSLLISKAKKRKGSSRLISRTLKKANLPANFKSYPVEKLQELIKEEYKA